MNLSGLSSEHLQRRLRRLTGNERQIQVAFLLHLAEFDERRGFADLGYASLWEYCEKALGFRDACAWRRTYAARLVRRHPEAAEYLMDGRLSMTTLVLLRDVVDERNARELFELASGKSKAEVEYLVACRRPRPEPTSFVRKLAAPNAAAPPLPVEGLRLEFAPGGEATLPDGMDGMSHDAGSGHAPVVSVAPATASATAPVPVPANVAPLAAARPKRATVEPIAEDRYVIRVVVDRAFVEKLEAAGAAVSHVIPRRDIAAVLLRGLDELLAREAKKHAPPEKKKKNVRIQSDAERDSNSAAPKPASSRPKGNARPVSTRAPAEREREREKPSRAISADVKRAVWKRDGGCCSWVRADGTVCGSKWKLEYDHVTPIALGGESTVEGVRLLCFAHNQEAARRIFGNELIDRYRRKGDRRRRRSKNVEVRAGTG